jgi:hypothetical protein
MLEQLLFKKIELWAVGLIVILVTLLLGTWGFSVMKYHVFPYTTLLKLSQFVGGHQQDKRSLFKRLKAEFSFDPLEFEAFRQTELIPRSKLRDIASIGNETSGKGVDAEHMQFFSNTEDLRYFVVFGSFIFPRQEMNIGAVLIDTEGTLHRAWTTRPDKYQYLGPHIGLAVAANGDILTNTNGILSSYGWCGEKNWEAPWSPAADGIVRKSDAADGYDWHHDIAVVEGKVYSFVGASLMTVDGKTGEVLSEINAADLISWAWDSGLYIFDARRKKLFTSERLNKSNLVNLFYADPFHFNKADVLTADKAGQYDEFEAGDILLSLRELNMVVVVRPSTKKIVWHRYGLTQAQHDATFNDGNIDVFDNNSSSEPANPRIVRLNLEKNEAETLFNLSDWGLVMRAKGNFELRGKQLLVTDDEAGRMIYGNLNGDIDFVFENTFRPDGLEPRNLALRSATEISPELVRQFESGCGS